MRNRHFMPCSTILLQNPLLQLQETSETNRAQKRAQPVLSPQHLCKMHVQLLSSWMCGTARKNKRPHSIYFFSLHDGNLCVNVYVVGCFGCCCYFFTHVLVNKAVGYFVVEREKNGTININLSVFFSLTLVRIICQKQNFHCHSLTAVAALSVISTFSLLLLHYNLFFSSLLRACIRCEVTATKDLFLNAFYS